MQGTTRLLTEIEPETKKGESLYFELCKGGYFSDTEEYGLKVIGKTVQNGTPTPEDPVPIQCVKQGTRILCGNEITVPCDLYEGDIWYPMSGRVERIMKKKIFTGSETFYGFSNNITMYVDISVNSIQDGNNPYAVSSHYKRIWGNGVSFSNGVFNVMRSGNYWARIMLTTDLINISDFKNWLKEQYNSGSPVTVIYKLAIPIIENYSPQPIFAPKGTVNVNQQVIEQAAELSATMLVKR